MSASPWLERLRQVDVAGFYLINGSLRSALFDALMPFITDKWNFIAPLAILLLYVFLFRPRRDQILALSAVAVVLLADVTAYFLKDLFHRIRPCHALSQVHLLAGAACTGTFSFPSNHASNIFALATFFSYNYRRLMIPCFITAALIGYSRVYLGAHYPADVIGGVVWGVLVGLAAATIARRLTRVGQVHHPNLSGEKEDQPVPPLESSR